MGSFLFVLGLLTPEGRPSRVLYMALGLLLGACPAPSTPTVDAYDDACRTLATLGCPEADDRAMCVTTMRRAQTERLTDYNPPCVAASTSVDAVRACSPAWRHGCRGPRTAP